MLRNSLLVMGFALLGTATLAPARVPPRTQVLPHPNGPGGETPVQFDPARVNRDVVPPALPGRCRVLSHQDRMNPLKALAPTKREFRAVLPRRRNRCLIGAPL